MSAAEDIEIPGFVEVETAEAGPSVAYVASVAGEPWPEPLGEAAYHGVAGDFVRHVAPCSESDPAALLMQFLAAAGNVCGRGPYVEREADRHGTNLFVAIVGESAKGRKGTALGHVKRVALSADETWKDLGGLSSGEGVIWAVRDPITKQEAIREKKGGKVTGYQTVQVDPGVDDKRLFVVESELASVLKVMGREGNTLSAILRQAWDSGTIRTMTKNSPATATDAHVSIVGHITRQELRRYLEDTEAANGFGNRILWACARRSQRLPFGGKVPAAELEKLARALRRVVEQAPGMGRLEFDRQAADLWVSVYEMLSEGHPGLFGAVTGRAEAQVTRLALLYAVLEGDRLIREPHLRAALEAWRYCEDSARHIFGDALGDEVADRIHRALREAPEGLTRTEIRDLFGRHVSSTRAEGALRALAELGRVRVTHEQTGGRPTERWLAYGIGGDKSDLSDKSSGGGGLSSLLSHMSQPAPDARRSETPHPEAENELAEPSWLDEDDQAEREAAAVEAEVAV